MPLHARLAIALIAAFLTTSCASWAPPAIAPPRPLPAATMQPCPDPPVPPAGPTGVDVVAEHLKGMYDLYGTCAGLHRSLLDWLETGGTR